MLTTTTNTSLFACFLLGLLLLPVLPALGTVGGGEVGPLRTGRSIITAIRVPSCIVLV